MSQNGAQKRLLLCVTFEIAQQRLIALAHESQVSMFCKQQLCLILIFPVTSFLHRSDAIP